MAERRGAHGLRRTGAKLRNLVIFVNVKLARIGRPDPGVAANWSRADPH